MEWCASATTTRLFRGSSVAILKAQQSDAMSLAAMHDTQHEPPASCAPPATQWRRGLRGMKPDYACLATRNSQGTANHAVQQLPTPSSRLRDRAASEALD